MKPRVEASCVHSLSPLARAYLAALLNGEIDNAKSTVRAMVSRREDLAPIYEDILQPVQEAVSDLREAGEVSSSAEHFMTMTTQELMDEFAPLVFESASSGTPALITTGPHDIDDVRARMTADLMELAGFDTHFLSGPRDADVVAVEIEQCHPAVVVVMPGRQANCAAAEMVHQLAPRMGAAVIAVSEDVIRSAPGLRGLVASFAGPREASRAVGALLSREQCA